MRVRPLAVATLLCLSACINRCADTIGEGIDHAIEAGFGCAGNSLGEAIDNAIANAIEGSEGRPVNGAVVTDVDGGIPRVDAYQNLPGGYVHLTYYGGLTSGAIPQKGPDCLQDDLYYHDLTQGMSYPVSATIVVYTDGTTPGSRVDVALMGIVYGPEDASQGLSLDLRVTETIYAELPPTADGGDAGEED
jgi:hypothetical protein